MNKQDNTKAPIGPIVLTILDGWGYRSESESNAIHQAHTPVWDKLWMQYPHGLLQASGDAVGLPSEQMGNSEVGHITLGSGRIVYQELTRIGHAIEKNDFNQNLTLTKAIDSAISKKTAIHVMGLVSNGGVHSHEDHIIALFELAASRGAKQIYLHAFGDGRDTAPNAIGASLDKFDACFERLGIGRFASLSGRYYAMDRDQRWDRVKKVYQLLTQGSTEQAETAQAALAAAYARNETDEFIEPTQIGNAALIQDDDVVIFMNFRADRARQLSQCFVDPDFNGFVRQQRPKLQHFVSLTQYQKALACEVAYPPQHLNKVLGELVAAKGMRQLRIAETEKYAHVTFFFNGGEEVVYPGEDRILINSPDVATYDLQPEMSAPELTDKLVAAIKKTDNPYQLIICNFANTDMVGHTGKLDAAKTAVETLDRCLKRISEALLAVNGEMLLTADHGNAEQLYNNETDQAHTAHTMNPVPLIYISKRPASLEKTGNLADIAPSILALLGLEIPAEMTGHNLIHLENI